LVKTEESKKEGLFRKENRFFIEGEGNIKHTYNNGHIANDPVLASQNFMKALEKLPSTIENYKKKTERLIKDLPVLQEVTNSTWRKEDELKELKSELSALERKIQLSLKPIDTGQDKPEEKQDETKQIEKISDKDLAVQQIHALFRGELRPQDIGNKSPASVPVSEGLKGMKEVMGDRLVIASVPKFKTENQSKGFKI
jgi:predicted RNase H-like nuclease (RuvC/YqgF family)